MNGWKIFAIVAGVFALCVAIVLLLISYYCFRRIFYSDRSKKTHFLPDEEIYRPFHERMIVWRNATLSLPHRNVEITTFDGLTLRGKYFEYEKGAPIELMLHGYRGTSERDLCAGVLRAFKQGRSVLFYDHRGSGESDGSVITFGVNESRDCLKWVDYILENIDRDAKIILTGISMGAATVMICASQPLPKNVAAVLADCGFTSAKDIIQKVIRDMKLPPKLLYPFVRLGAKLFGRFDVDEFSPIESMKKCRLPIIFIHGANDDYVPWQMSVELHDACASENKRLVLIENAAHGLAYPENPEKYLAALDEFFTPILR